MRLSYQLQGFVKGIKIALAVFIDPLKLITMSQLSEKKYTKGYRNTKYTFAGFPSAKIYKASTGKKWNNHLLFGDYIKIINTNVVDGRVYVKSRNSRGWVKVSEIQKERILEVNFVDIGQGDGCHVVTPDDQHILIDAGKTDNMLRYLIWRFNLYDKKRPLSFPFKVVISHSDLDHYKGFAYIFDNDKIKVDEIYHNGLVERPGPAKERLGTVEDGHFTALVQNTAEMLALITEPNNRKGTGSTYCKTLYKVLKHNDNVNFKMLSVKDEYLPGFEKDNEIYEKENSIEILGPITNETNGKTSLKTINNLGKDKNGHSVILKLKYGAVKILLGGDVNTEFGEIIHKYYADKGALDNLVVDVAKACHHGSNHFYYDFVKSINASATIISSGDEESYAHPRPDAIGAFGKCGYGERPLIYSTELARSNKEFTYEKLEGISTNFNKLAEHKADLKVATEETEKKDLGKKIKKVNKEINSFLTKYGMINVRTDGKKLIIAQKYEVSSAHGKWDIQELEYSETTKRFELVKAHS